jgi:hypothetical protein
MRKYTKLVTVNKGEGWDPNKKGSADLPDGFYAVHIKDEQEVKKDKNGNNCIAVKVEVTEPGSYEGWNTSIYLNLDSDAKHDVAKIQNAVLSVGYDEGEEFDTENIAEMLAGKDSIIQVKSSKKVDPRTGQPYRANLLFVTQEQRDEGEGTVAKKEAAPVAAGKKPSLADKLKAKK